MSSCASYIYTTYQQTTPSFPSQKTSPITELFTLFFHSCCTQTTKMWYRDKIILNFSTLRDATSCFRGPVSSNIKFDWNQTSGSRLYHYGRTDRQADRERDMTNLFSEYNRQVVTFLKFIYFCNTLYMFQTVFPSIIRNTKLLPAASLARLAAGNSVGLTNRDAVCAVLCSWWWAENLSETCTA